MKGNTNALLITFGIIPENGKTIGFSEKEDLSLFYGISLFFDSYPGIHCNDFIAGTQQRVNIHFLNFHSEA